MSLSSSSPARTNTARHWPEAVRYWAYRHPSFGAGLFRVARGRKALRELVARSEFEPRRLLRRLRNQGFEPSVILDVGANRGDWTRIAARVFPNATLRLLEPQVEMKPFLERVQRDISDTAYRLTAAGARETSLELTVWGDMAGSSLMSPRSGDGAIRGKRLVPVMTLDQLVADGFMPCPDLVKVDVQGYELEVMRGAQHLLGVTEAIILEVALMEFMPGRPLIDEVIKQMAEWGYHIFDLAGSARRPRDGVLSHLDLCFVREDSELRGQQRWS